MEYPGWNEFWNSLGFEGVTGGIAGCTGENTNLNQKIKLKIKKIEIGGPESNNLHLLGSNQRLFL